MFPNRTITRDLNTFPVSTPTFQDLVNKNFNEKFVRNRSETLMMPFDSETWLLMLLSVFGVILTAVSFSRMKTTLRENMWNKTFWTISTILGQTDADWTRAEFLNCGGKWFIFIGVWYAVIFLLDNFYQGELFSCMTAKLGPYVPSKLDQLLQETDWDIVTMSDAWRNNKFPESILTVGMIPDLLAATGNNGRKKFLQKLSERTKYISGNKFQIASNISGKLGVTSTNGTIVEINLPIIVFDRVVETEMFVEAIQSFLNPIVVRNHAMTPFNSRVPWVGKRNFLYPLYSRGLGQLDQSGIFGQWKKFINLAKKRRQGYIFLKGRSRSIFLRKMLHVGGNG
ncbi:Histidinol-phosphate aminotransferase 2 [Folsomia candida]|uniref:Histidinol-phosphate aminotransferase 2 n=1 Tax=Folsomia candida TaxID=158441 RepID=A0A226EAF9_FOLCA|nr:Histidinol-phosphate aminotransferase 2 [Folsomia candida]